MLTDFSKLLEAAQHEKGKTVVSVACAHDEDVLLAVEEALKKTLASFILVGDETTIISMAQQNKISLEGCRIIPAQTDAEAAYIAAKEVAEGRAQMIQKGLLDSGVFIKAVLDKSLGLRGESLMSHVSVFQIPGYDRLMLLTDAAVNLSPGLEEKKVLIQNAVVVAHALGISNPIVSVLCATEKVNEKMPATIDAQGLVDMNKKGEITGCRIGGPFALDNAISSIAAMHKGIADPLAGHADILLTPTLECGNVLYKSLIYFANSRVAGNIIGAKIPILLNSRADSADTKLLSLALGIIVSSFQRKGEPV